MAERLRRLLTPEGLFTSGVVLAVCAVLLWPTPGNPPGFHRDEASAAYNAYTIATTGRDEDGNRLPLFFESYGGYLSPVFPYLLAGVFLVRPPSVELAREVGATAILAAVLLLGVLAFRRTRSVGIAIGTLLLAAATPWLYELGRTGFEMTVMPASLVALLLAVDWAHRAEQRPWPIRGVAVGLALALLTYSYAAGRGLAPFLAVALAVFLRRDTRWPLAAWLTYAALLVPLLFHLDAARARLDQVTAFPDGAPLSEKAHVFVSNYLHDARLWTWLTGGDTRPTHVTGVGHLLVPVLVLAIVGAVTGLRARDRWTAWLVLAVVAAPIPAATTNGREHAERLLALPVLLLALAIGGLTVVGSLAPRARSIAVGVAVVVALVQVAGYTQAYRDRGGARTGFDAGVGPLLARAYAESPVVYTDYDDRYGHTLTRWYAVTHGIDPARAVTLSDGGIPPHGAIIFGRLQECDFVCIRLAEADTFWIARTETGS